MQEKYLDLARSLAIKLGLPVVQVENTISLLIDKVAVPCIARYRKLQTGNMSLINIRLVANAVNDLHELEERREAILKCIGEQNKLSAELREILCKANTLQSLEDIYLPYRPQRQTKSIKAKQRGLGLLATELLTTYAESTKELADKFVNDEKGVLNSAMALEGARQILMDSFAEDVDFLKIIRDYFWENAVLFSVSSKARGDKNNKYKEFANYSQLVKKIPDQKILSIFSGRTDNFLKISVSLENSLHYGTDAICDFFNLDKDRVAASTWLNKVIQDTWTQKLCPKLESETLHKLRDIAGSFACKDLSSYLRGLFYLPAAGPVITMGLLPNAKGGVAVAVIDELGNPLDTFMIYPVGLQGDWYQALAYLAKVVVRFNVKLISVANLVGYRDIERLCRELVRMYPDLQLAVNVIDAYAIMEYAQTQSSQKELENYDLGARAVISVARRSQNPLAEFAKIDSNELSLAQHDFWQAKYQTYFAQILEDSVCAIGLDLNKASWQLLSKLPGIDINIAKQIVEYRKKNGNFKSREDLKNLVSIDEHIYQQIAGFVYVYNGINILDTLNVHPNSYYVIEKMAQKLAVNSSDLIANGELLDRLVSEEYVDAKHSIECIKSIINWLKYKVQDPRGEFKLPKIKHGVETINDLYKDLELEGIVSKITNYGIFVDVGVLQDGLIHLSLIKEKCGKNIKVGKIVKVKVADVDINKKRFSLILKNNEKNNSPRINKVNKRPDIVKNKYKSTQSNHVFNTAMADALAKLKKGGDG